MSINLKYPELAATLSSALFAGASLYINVGQHPAMLQAGTEHAATIFPPMYKRAAAMQFSLAVLSTAFGIQSYLQNKQNNTGILWAIGSLCIFSVIPVTKIFIAGINKKLLIPGRDKKSQETRELLEKWGPRHLIRTVLSLASSGLFLIALSQN